ncbi:hypothetical protein AKJ18_10360 [Vibrio xuii]|nr:hypothetical protein AKJ18_10360 [Vibrio xuii]
MFEYRHHPWFMLYVAVVVSSCYFALRFGIALLLISMISVILVEFKAWPNSKIWSELSSFSFINRYLVGGYITFLIGSYLTLGINSWLVHIFVLGGLMFLLERKVINSKP